MVACFNGTVETDVSLPHDFDFTSQLPTDDSVIPDGIVEDCYSPNVDQAISKIGGGSKGHNSNINITNINDVASIIGGDPSKITGFSFYIIDDKSSTLEVPSKDIKVDPDGSIHLTPKVDTSQLVKFLTGGSVQVCLMLSGDLSKDFPKKIHNNFTFHVEMDTYRSI